MNLSRKEVIRVVTYFTIVYSDQNMSSARKLLVHVDFFITYIVKVTSTNNKLKAYAPD